MDIFSDSVSRRFYLDQKSRKNHTYRRMWQLTAAISSEIGPTIYITTKHKTEVQNKPLLRTLACTTAMVYPLQLPQYKSGEAVTIGSHRRHQEVTSAHIDTITICNDVKANQVTMASQNVTKK